MKQRPTPLTLLFVLLIFLFGFISLPFNGWNIIKDTGRITLEQFELKKVNFGVVFGAFNTAVLERFSAKAGFIDFYGSLSKLMDKKVIFDVDPDLHVYQLTNGQLGWITPNQYSLDEGITQLMTLNTVLKSKGIPMLYVNVPIKLALDNSALPYPVTDYSEAMVEELNRKMSTTGIDYLDMKQVIVDHDLTMNQLYFKTDHHWNAQSGLWGAQIILDKMKALYGFNYDPSHFLIDNYTVKTYKNWFLGSLGKRVGTTYIGVDDFDVLTPQFPTQFTVSIPSKNISNTGEFKDTVMFYNNITKRDYYGKNPYAINMGGDYDLIRVTNENGRDKPKIVIVKDSFSDVITPFMADEFSEMIIVDLRKLNGTTLIDVIEKEKPSMVLFIYAADKLGVENTISFFTDK